MDYLAIIMLLLKDVMFCANQSNNYKGISPATKGFYTS